MPHSTQEILDSADELAKRFEDYEPAEGDRKDAAALRVLRAAVLAHPQVEVDIAASVTAARCDGHSWSSIAAMLGTSVEAARHRYGDAATPSD